MQISSFLIVHIYARPEPASLVLCYEVLLARQWSLGHEIKGLLAHFMHGNIKVLFVCQARSFSNDRSCISCTGLESGFFVMRDNKQVFFFFFLLKMVLKMTTYLEAK